MAKSWRLKVDRAEVHIKEVEGYIDAFAKKHPYEAFLAPRLKKKPHIWHHHLRITEQPDEMIAVVIGEILYDYRSALDHLACALNPRSRRGSAYFPIETKPIWDNNPDGSWVLVGEAHDKARDSFGTAVKGMKPEAVTLIKSVQPYQLRDGDEPAVLDLLNRLENRDKHQELVTVSSWVSDITAHMVGSWGDNEIFCGDVEDGANLFTTDWYHLGGRLIPPESEVNVKISGIPKVSLKIGDIDGLGRLPLMLENMTLQVRHIFDALEPYLKS